MLPDRRTALWVAALGTWCYRAFRVFPYLSIRSAEKRCGKSRLLGLLARVCFNASPVTAHPTEAQLYRSAAWTGGARLFDEVETLRATRIASELLRGFGLTLAPDDRAAAGLDLFTEVLARLVTDRRDPVALIADFASRSLVRPDGLSPVEHQAFTRALILARETRSRPFGSPPRPFFNPVPWIADDDQLERRGLLDREIGGFCAFQDLIHVGGSEPPHVGEVRAI